MKASGSAQTSSQLYDEPSTLGRVARRATASPSSFAQLFAMARSETTTTQHAPTTAREAAERSSKQHEDAPSSNQKLANESHKADARRAKSRAEHTAHTRRSDLQAPRSTRSAAARQLTALGVAGFATPQQAAHAPTQHMVHMARSVQATRTTEAKDTVRRVSHVQALQAITDQAHRTAAAHGRSRLVLALEPEHLGPLIVHLERDGDHISARLVVTHDDAAQLLRSDAATLHAKLSELGFTDVDLAIEQEPVPLDT